MTKLARPHLESLEQQVRTALVANDLGGLRSLRAAHTDSPPRCACPAPTQGTHSRGLQGAVERVIAIY